MRKKIKFSANFRNFLKNNSLNSQIIIGSINVAKINVEL